MKTVIGIDFGSDSARAILVNSRGTTLNEAVFEYPRWKEKRFCDASINAFRQHPADHLEALCFLIPEVLKGQDRSLLAGIATDSTSSTVCAVDEEGVPLAMLPEFQNDPDAMFFLWKDHSATAEADEINRIAENFPGEDFRKYSGGAYSCEWFWSKALYILRRNPEVAARTASFVEHGDWISALLCGNTLPSQLKRSRCFAGHKSMWNRQWNGMPPQEFFHQLDEKLAAIAANMSSETYTADVPVGVIAPSWAERFDVPLDVVIGGSMIDCHAGAVGAGIQPGELIKVVGTSSCDIIVSRDVQFPVEGICGQVDGSVLPGYTGLEAGQAAFGDIFAWFKNILEYTGGKADLEKITSEAARLAPGSSGVAACDHFNGRRSPFADALCTGAITGLTLGTTVPEIYRALAESAVFGARRIVEHLQQNNIEINTVKAVGGISQKSPFIMQLFADILNMPVAVSSAPQACALGAAIFAAVAAKIYPDVFTAMENMSAKTSTTYQPDPSNTEIYQQLYSRYCR